MSYIPLFFLPLHLSTKSNAIHFIFPALHFYQIFAITPTCQKLAMQIECKNDHINVENVLIVDKADNIDVKYDHLDGLARVLHKSARSFSVAIKHRDSVRSCPELAKAWVGVDVHAWHKHIAYQVAVYTMLKTITEGKYTHSDEHMNEFSPVHDILHTKTSSGVAVVFLAISCCIAIEKLGAGRISCPTFTQSIPSIVGELMDLSHSLAPMDKLHSLASAAGHEGEFLSHFGAKREGVVSRMQSFRNRQDLERDLATLGLFAFLGSRTRLFLSDMGIKDLDEQIKDFLSYLECAIVFIYPELSSLPLYQLFMEVIDEEIGWLDLYAAVPCIGHHERRRSKQHAIQAEQEIILCAVFSVCSDVFSGFALFSNSTQLSLDTNMVAFLLQSRNLLTICLDDYLAAYYRSGELLKHADRFVPQQTMRIQVTPQHKSKLGIDVVRILKFPFSAQIKPICASIFKKYRKRLITFSCDILLGTRLLFIDMSTATSLLLKHIRGHKVTEREMKKLKRTLVDFATVIPVTILMLLPVSAVGHAAMLAGIKKYIPCLIPSSYSSKRLDIAKQLDRTKMMEVKS
ncbi:hypothetical protein IFM89_003791 [Coptis chinensis]|uniref:Letm1 RBD domain-containing protein n=1 Tax=Coptis chinensis TaxID=261450 RepID=A0A835I7P8_9MAGN|nr:hypothetical protein IFM89_003791 [Coptis chinensis]